MESSCKKTIPHLGENKTITQANTPGQNQNDGVFGPSINERRPLRAFPNPFKKNS
jgi:hypothetical protein